MANKNQSFCLAATVFAILLLPASAAADLFKCGDIWSNKPCETPPGKVLPETQRPVEDKRASFSNPPSIPSSVQAQPSEIRRRILSRPEPKFDWYARPFNTRDFRITGRVSGHGKTRITLSWFVPRTTTKVAKSYVFKLPDRGGEETFEWTVTKPGADYWEWLMRAEYEKGWLGYVDLSGCCSHHDGLAVCQEDGAVICQDGNSSPTCRCENENR